MSIVEVLKMLKFNKNNIVNTSYSNHIVRGSRIKGVIFLFASTFHFATLISQGSIYGFFFEG